MTETKDPCGFWCDEYTNHHEDHKGKGYCWQYNQPTSEELLKQCRKDILDWAGQFCFYECPFFDDMEGCLCEDAGVSDILSCPMFNEALNLALGGADTWEYEYFFDHGFAYYRGAPLP